MWGLVVISVCCAASLCFQWDREEERCWEDRNTLVLVARAPEFMVLAAFLLKVRTAFMWETFRWGLFSTDLRGDQVISFFAPPFSRSALEPAEKNTPFPKQTS